MTAEEKETEKNKKELEKAREEDAIERERVKAIREKSPVDALLKPLKVGDKVLFWSACYKDKIESYHAEILSIEKFVFVPEKTSKADAYAGQGGTYYYAKVKDIIGKDTCLTSVSILEKV